MNEIHPKFILFTATSGMYSSLKSLPKPPNVLSASRTLRFISADDIYPIGVKWSPFFTPGISRKIVARLLSLKGSAPSLPVSQRSLALLLYQGRFKNSILNYREMKGRLTLFPGFSFLVTLI